MGRAERSNWGGVTVNTEVDYNMRFRDHVAQVISFINRTDYT